jgi:hypothetical protein
MIAVAALKSTGEVIPAVFMAGAVSAAIVVYVILMNMAISHDKIRSTK